MSWFLVKLQADAGCVHVLSDALLQTGAVSVEVTDAYAGTPREHALFAEPGESDTLPWELVNVRALYDEGADIAALVAAALRASNLDPAHGFDVERVADRDWVRATQSQFRPLQLSSRLWVVPTWHAPPDPGAINLIIDPGLAFGTGTHPTTRLCLNWLDANLRGGETVLDYGCGSGILAIAAVKIRAVPAGGVGIKTPALPSARDNSQQNQTRVGIYGAHASGSFRL